jgi:hypothetical protein
MVKPGSKILGLESGCQGFNILNMRRKRVTLEYFAQRLGTKDFNKAAFFYLAYKGSGLSLSKWLGEDKKKAYTRKKKSG